MSEIRSQAYDEGSPPPVEKAILEKQRLALQCGESIVALISPFFPRPERSIVRGLTWPIPFHGCQAAGAVKICRCHLSRLTRTLGISRNRITSRLIALAFLSAGGLLGTLSSAKT